jgi:hypothetical protein
MRTLDRLAGLVLIFAWVGALAACASAQAAGQGGVKAVFDPQRHMRVDEVEQGMTGYGMSVYSGIEPEPFPVVVVSVERGFQPDKAVVWIRCTDERMQMTGPVQGMSGSPIYLWPPGAKDTKIGTGGRIIGAFAFGFRFGKDCYIGVQPIEQMLAAGSRARVPAAGEPRQGGGPRSRDQMFASVYELARRSGIGGDDRARLDALAHVAGYRHQDMPAPLAAEPAGFGSRTPMALPMTVSSPAMASALEPFLTPLGLAPQSTAGAGGPRPPAWIQPDQAKIKPGSVFTIPLVSGPIDMTALGTTTDVLPDGTALAFGHQFLAEGAIEAPMATGFVHFVQPNISASFKVGGALRVTGAVVRDEQTAVVGLPGVHARTVPAKLHIQWPLESQNVTHDYRIVHHDRLLPAMLGATLAASSGSDTVLARDNTLTLGSTIRFANGKTLRLDRTLPSANSNQLMIAMIPALSAVLETEFGSMQVESIDTRVKIEPQIRLALIVSAILEESTVQPGDTVHALVRLKPYRQDEQVHRLAFQLPTQMPEGNYSIAVGGAPMLLQQRLGNRPHLLKAENIDDLFDAVQEQLSVKDEAIYGVMQLQHGNHLAIGRSELPFLPSSRAALLAVETSTRASSFVQSVEVAQPMPYVVTGQVVLPFSVKQDPDTNP